jgi:hypothetical protein
MIFDMEEETLLPADFSYPTRRASRQYRTQVEVAFEHPNKTGYSGQTTPKPTTQISLIDTIAHALKVLLLWLLGAAAAVVLMAGFQYWLISIHLINWPM